MTDRLLYALALPASTQTQSRAELRRNLSKQGILDSGGSGVVEGISLQPGEHLLTGRFAGEYAAISAAEVEELLDGSGIEVVPFAGRDERTDADGYYRLQDVSVETLAPSQSRRYQSFDGTIARVGTKRTHYRSVRTNASPVENPFGSESKQELGIPAHADRARWWNPSGGELTQATVQDLRAGEHADVAVYDATEPSFDDPRLVYSVDYEHEWPVDCRVWDTFGREKEYHEYTGATVGSTQVGGATVGTERVVASTWMRCYRTSHEFRGWPVIENDLVRLELREGRLLAYRWDAADSVYSLVQLGASDWRFAEVSVTHIGAERVNAQLTFSDGVDDHTLNMSLKRGRRDVLIYNPDNEVPVPNGLVDRLEPIADTSGQDPSATATVESKDDVLP